MSSATGLLRSGGGEKSSRKEAAQCPSEEDIALHNLTHIPFRIWCPACLAGRGRSHTHETSSSKQEESLPEFHVDFWYIGNRTAKGGPPARLSPRNRSMLRRRSLRKMQRRRRWRR